MSLAGVAYPLHKRKKQLTLVVANDWEALYVDGKVYKQGHHVQLVEALRELKLVNIEEVSANNHQSNDLNNWFPDWLGDVVTD